MNRAVSRTFVGRVSHVGIFVGNPVTDTEGEFVGFVVGETVGVKDSKPDPTGDCEGETVGDRLGLEVAGKRDGLCVGGLLGDFDALMDLLELEIDKIYARSERKQILIHSILQWMEKDSDWL